MLAVRKTVKTMLSEGSAMIAHGHGLIEKCWFCSVAEARFSIYTTVIVSERVLGHCHCLPGFHLSHLSISHLALSRSPFKIYVFGGR